MSEKTFEAATVEAALEQAAADLGVDPGDLEHEVVEEKRDFWGGGDDSVKIKAWARAPEPEPVVEEPEPDQDQEPEPDDEPAADAAPDEDAGEAEAPAERAGGARAAKSTGGEDDASAAGTEAAEGDEPAAEAPKADAEAADGADDKGGEAEAPPAPARKGGDPATDVEPAAISKLLEQIFHDMEFDCTVEVAEQPDGFLATISGDDKDALLEGNGRCLSALELIANNAFRHKLPRGDKVRVDAGDFRSRRDEELSDLAFQVAHSAKESGRTQETQPLNPYERRLVHLALAEDSAVTTRSRGSGFLKNVQVIPQKRGGGRGRGGRGRHN